MTTIADIIYEAQKKQIAAMNAGIMTPLWDWGKILEYWNKRGPLYNGMPELEEEPAYIVYNGIPLGLEVEDEPVHIDTKKIYEIE